MCRDGFRPGRCSAGTRQKAGRASSPCGGGRTLVPRVAHSPGNVPSRFRRGRCPRGDSPEGRSTRCSCREKAHRCDDRRPETPCCRDGLSLFIRTAGVRGNGSISRGGVPCGTRRSPRLATRVPVQRRVPGRCGSVKSGCLMRQQPATPINIEKVECERVRIAPRRSGPRPGSESRLQMRAFPQPTERQCRCVHSDREAGRIANACAPTKRQSASPDACASTGKRDRLQMRAPRPSGKARVQMRAHRPGSGTD
jgi:hypothetical protein